MSDKVMSNLGLGVNRITQFGHDFIAGQHYALPSGDPQLREAIARYEKTTADRVTLTTGVSMGLVASLATLSRPFSVLCPRPYYPAYPEIVRMLGGQVIYYDLSPERDPPIDETVLADRIRSDTRALLWNFPHNPTGLVPTGAHLEAMYRVARQASLLVISDESFADLTYDGVVLPDMGNPPVGVDLVRLKGFSKSFGMPGERLGYVLGEPEHLSQIARRHWLLALSPPVSAQLMARELLARNPQERIDRLRRQLAANRDLFSQAVASCHQLQTRTPQAGLFFWLRLTDSHDGSHAVARRCASQTGTILSPGSYFGVDDPVYLRASFAVEQEELKRGCERLTRFATAM